MTDPRALRWHLVVVAHNSAHYLRRYWSDRTWPDWVRITVVDNGSTDESAAVALDAGVELLPARNLGLSSGNNLGAKSQSSDLIVFCNPDVHVSLEQLLQLDAFLDHHGGIVAPRLVGEDGADQPNARKFPSILSQVLPRLGLSAGRSYLWPSVDPTNPTVDWVTGAFVAMRRSTFDQIGGWPEEYFLYFEDVEFCWRAAEAGIPVRVAEHIRVTHDWVKGSKSLIGRLARIHFRSAVIFYSRRRPGARPHRNHSE